MAKKNKGNNVLRLDFSQSESDFGVPAGDHLAKIDKIEVKVSDRSGQKYIQWQFKALESGKKIRHNTSLQPKALFALRKILEAVGYEIEGSIMTLDLDALIGEELGIAVEIEKYQGKKRSEVVDIFPASELEDEEYEDDDEEYEDDDDTEDDTEQDDNEDQDDETSDEDDDSTDEDDDDTEAAWEDK